MEKLDNIDREFEVLERSILGIGTTHDPTLDARVDVITDEGELTAYLKITPPKSDGRMVSFEEVVETIKKAGILNPDIPIIKEAIEKRLFRKNLVIAKGKEPIHGKDASILLKVMNGDMVKEGQHLATKLQLTKGLLGYSVKGIEIPPKDGRDVRFVVGEHVKLSKDGVDAFAEVDGVVFWDGKSLCVKEIPKEAIEVEDLLSRIKGSVYDPSLDAKLGIGFEKEGASLIITPPKIESLWDTEWIPKALDKMESQIEGLSQSIFELARGPSNLDGRMEVEFRKDEIEAYLIIIPPMVGGRAVDEKDVHSHLEGIGIKAFDKDIVKRMIQGRVFNRPIFIAKGLPATEGKDAYYLYRVDGDERVIQGQVLMVNVPPKEGPPGVTVKGEVIPPKYGKDKRLFFGKGVVVNRDGTIAYAAREGIVNWDGDLLSVEEVYDVEGGVEEDIWFDGRVRINGGVGSGVRISSTSSIEIHGDVEGAIIDTGGNLSVYGNLYESKISSRGDVVANEIKGGEVKAGGWVVVRDEVLNAKVDVGKFLICRDGRGEVSGGEIIARDGVDVRVIGCSSERTSLIIGKDGKVKIRGSIYRGSVYPGVEIKMGEVRFHLKEKKDRFTMNLEDGKVMEGAYEPEEFSPTIMIEKPRYKDEFRDLFPSIVIIAQSIDEAKREGIRILGIEDEEIGFQMIDEQEDVVKVRVFLKKDEEFFKTFLIKKEIEENKDGYYRISNTENGMFLTVFPPSGKGRAVDPKDVLEKIIQNRYKDIQDDVVLKSVKEAIASPVKIGPRQYIRGLDGYIMVEIKGDGKAAYMTLIPPKKGGIEVSFDGAMEDLYRHGVVAGIKEDVVRDAIASKRFDTPILVAAEIPPQAGKGGEIEYKFRTDQRIRLIPDKDGRIDFKELGLIQNVKAGDLLAIKRLATSGGIPGRKVTGEVIPSPSPPDVKLPAGKNIILSEDGLELRAGIDGQVVLSGGRISVEPIFEVKGNLDMSIGNIDFLGAVDIMGDVGDGFKVMAKGDIQIRGCVGKAYLNAGGSIAIDGGIQGGDEGKIYSGKDIICKFVEGAHLFAVGRIIVSQSTLHSRLNSEEDIEVLGGRGCIIGGWIRAKNKITTRVIGSPSETLTVIEVGVSPRVRQQLFNLEGIYKEEMKEVEELRVNCATLKAKGPLSQEMERLLNDIIRRYDELTKNIRSYKERRRLLEEEILRSKTGSIIVLDTVYPGVKIVVRSAQFLVKEVMRGVIFTFEDNHVKISPYKG